MFLVNQNSLEPTTDSLIQVSVIFRKEILIISFYCRIFVTYNIKRWTVDLMRSRKVYMSCCFRDMICCAYRIYALILCFDLKLITQECWHQLGKKSVRGVILKVIIKTQQTSELIAELYQKWNLSFIQTQKAKLHVKERSLCLNAAIMNN